jgi:hypothetical protein
MAGRGSFQAIAPDNAARLMALKGAERWNFAAGESAAQFVERMDKMWAPIHCALSDGTLDGTLGEPPLCNAVLGDHLVYESSSGDYVYLKHPPEVVAIAKELETLTADQFADKWEQMEANWASNALGLSFTRAEADDFWPVVEAMREFYQRAATAGFAVVFQWG